MIQKDKPYLLTLALLALAVALPEPSHGTGRRDYFEVNSTIVNSHSSVREHMRRAGRDTTANVVLDSILARPKVRWRRADLDPQLRSRIHLSADEVPRFPEDDPKLMDPRNWPASKKIEGALCSLTVYVMDGTGSTWTRSIADSVTGVVFYLYYTDADTEFRSHETRRLGPFYDWLRGRLKQRSWTTGRGNHSRVRSYWPYPSGELFTFIEYEKKYNAQGHEISMKWIEEVFARDGTLIGCCVGPVNSWGACGGYWMGVDVGAYFGYQWLEALERSLEQPLTSGAH